MEFLLVRDREFVLWRRADICREVILSRKYTELRVQEERYAV